MTMSIIRAASILLAAASALAAPVAQAGSDTCEAVSEIVDFDAATPSTLLTFPYFRIQTPTTSEDFSTLILADDKINVALSEKSLAPKPDLVGSFSSADSSDFTLHSLSLAASPSQVRSQPHGMPVQARIDCLGESYNEIRGSKYWWANAKMGKVEFDKEEGDKKGFAACRQVRVQMLASDGRWGLFALGGVQVSKAC